MFSNIILKISNLTTVSTYIKSTLLFTLFTISENKNETILIVGLYFAVIAFLVNALVIMGSLIALYFEKQGGVKQKIWISIGFQLANIPIGIAYFYFILNDQTTRFFI